MSRCALVFLLLLIGLPGLQAQPSSSGAAREQIGQAIGDFGHIKVGMTRQDVEQYFSLDGGMNWRGQTYYVYQKCDLIKIEVTFELDSNVKNEFSPHDKITKLSKLYLEYPMRD